MFKERIYIYDLSGNYVNDPERSTDYATNLQFSSIWPKGYETCSFTVRRDIAAHWAVKSAYGVIIRDGLRIVWQGRLAGLEKAIRGKEEYITLRADGWYCVLADRTIRKRWADNAAIRRLLPSDQITADQCEFPMQKNDDYILVRYGSKDISRVQNDSYDEQYVMPTGTNIDRITFGYTMRSGEGVRMNYYNDEQAVTEGNVADSTGAVVTGTHDDTFDQGDTESCTLKFECVVTDTYDQSDYVRIYDLWFYGVMDSFGSPNYYADEIGQDVLEIVASAEISSDYDDLASPGLEILPFITINDTFETADNVLQRLAGFGDASDNTWGFSVWDKFGASDGLPKAELKQWATDDYEYQVSLADVNNFRDEEDVDEVKNWISVRYTDDDDIRRYVSPDDDASLKDTDSIADYYERHHSMDAGNCDQATAIELGTRFLSYHKDPPHRMSFDIQGFIRQKGDGIAPVGWVRAGDRIKMIDWNDGEIIFLRTARYDAETATLHVERDLPPDTLETFLAKRDAGIEKQTITS